MILIFLFLAISFCHAQDSVPEWAEGAVWYQIFPERFRSAAIQNDPIKERSAPDLPGNWQVHPWTSNWYKLQPWEKARGGSFYDVVFDRRYGGDLLGVIEKLDYLKDLGIDVIYFNPVFEARSLHKYDASTYHHIDNNFGPDREGDWNAITAETEDPSTWTFTAADKTFLELIQRAHEREIRIVIDGVFNHCGPEFWAFQDVVDNQQASPYAAWFDVVSWDNPATPDTNEFDYKGWWGYKGLPEFREDEAGLIRPVKEYIFNITRRWMDPDGDGDSSDGIDGWRLDVAKDVNPRFWEEWYQLVKALNPEAITVGELWDEASEWIRKKRFDSVMNYPFAYAVVDFFVDDKTKIAVTEFDKRLSDLRKVYPEKTNYILMNLLGGHDTDRLASMIRNPDRNYNREASVRHNPKYDPTKPTARDVRIQKLIAVFQMTYIGAPMIYYGDEAGMWGGTDPDDRKPMVWDDLTYENETYDSIQPDNGAVDPVQFNRELFEFYKRLVAIRHQNKALREGSFETLLIDPTTNMYAFRRAIATDEIIVALNNSDSSQTFELQIDSEKAWTDILGRRNLKSNKGKISLKLGPYEAAILANVIY